uniref:Uncharacterized protein n=1 Tax=Leersia perrieri TaxID=77586 RepID=A0A0D9UWZ0_9ORYZ
MDAREELALTVPGTLMLLGTDLMEALRLIEAAERELEADVVSMPVSDATGVLATRILEDARRKISSIASRHAMSGHLFVRYAAHHGIQHDPPCSSWDEHYRDAVRLTDKALRRVRDAASDAEAAVDTAVIAAGFRGNDIRQFTDWTLAALDHLQRAAMNATMALLKMHDARDAVALEFFDAWTIVRRGRSLSTARNIWRELALTVPATLMLISTETESSRLIELARSKLHERLNLLRSIREGTSPKDADDNFVDPEPEVVLPTVTLEDARREITWNAAHHEMIRHVFASYAAFLGIQDNPLYSRWLARHHDAVRHTNLALKTLRAAASCFMIASDAVGMMGDLPYYCPLWGEWAWKGQTFTSGADLFANRALDAMCRARQAICEQFFDAWVILRR